MILYLSTVAGAASDLARALPTSRLTIRFDCLLEPEKQPAIIMGYFYKSNKNVSYR
jgi:hypothetical protein